MQQAQITIQYINQPKEAHWTKGSVKDSAGQLWAVDKFALGMFQKGAMVTVGYEPPYGNNKYPTIVSVNGQAIGQSQAAGFTPAGQAAQAAMPAQAPWQPQTAQSAPVAAPAAPAAMPDTLLSNVLATAVEKGAIHSPNELELWASAIAQAHRVYHGMALSTQQQVPAQGNTQDGPPPGHPATQDLDPNDQVPF